MFKFLLFIYGLGFLLSLVAMIGLVVDAETKFRQKHPDIRLRKGAFPYASLIKAVISMLCPLLHWILVYCVMFHWDKLIQETITEVERQAAEESEGTDEQM